MSIPSLREPGNFNNRRDRHDDEIERTPALFIVAKMSYVFFLLFLSRVN